MLVLKENELTRGGKSDRVSRQAAEAPAPVHAAATTLGNQETQRLLAPRGALVVSEPGDSSELEAERLTDQIVDAGRRSVTAIFHDRCQAGSACYQRQATDHASSMGAASFVGSMGQPLDRASRAFFEPRLGRDLSDVRIHTGPEASRAARALNAQAFTIGRDIVFGDDRYTPHNNAGRRLLAHELVHTVQQQGTAAIQRQRGDAAESGQATSVRYHGMARFFELFINSTPPPFTLTMYAMTDDIVGHAWISIKAADGAARTIGFWPGSGGLVTLQILMHPLVVPGELRSEDPHKGQQDHSSSTVVSRNQMTKALDVIARFDHRMYSIVAVNCADFVEQVWFAVTGTSVFPYGDLIHPIWAPADIGLAADQRNELKAQK